MISIKDSFNEIDADYIKMRAADRAKREKRLAFWIGVLAICLGPAVLIIDGLFAPACLRQSISAYFYEPRSGPIFVFVLTFVAAFLFRYRGENPWDGRLAFAAGVAAILVAIVPTELEAVCMGGANQVDLRAALTFATQDGTALSLPIAPYFASASDGATHLMVKQDATFFGSFRWLHVSAAVFLLLVLFYFANFAFRRVRDEDRDANGIVVWQKRVRNIVYRACGIGMIISFLMIIAEFMSLPLNLGVPLVFLGEALALACFGVAWMVKGRFWLGWLDSPSG